VQKKYNVFTWSMTLSFPHIYRKCSQQGANLPQSYEVKTHAQSFRWCNIGWCHSQHLWRRAASPREEINLEPELVYIGFQFHFGVLNQKAFETLGVECQRHLMHRSATSDNSAPRVQARMRPARRAAHGHSSQRAHLPLLLSWSVLLWVMATLLHPDNIKKSEKIILSLSTRAHQNQSDALRAPFHTARGCCCNFAEFIPHAQKRDS
jgi:hypothetical protein